MGTDQLDRPPAYQLLANQLRAQITSGVLRPGDRLPTEPQLCARSGVSRSTVREALRVLASQHLIVTTRGVTGGSFVAGPSPAQLADTLSTGLLMLMASGAVSAPQWLELRETFEVPAAGLAARRRTDAHLAELAQALSNPATAPLDALITAHRSFHTTLALATANPLYQVITQPLYAVADERAMAERAPAGFWQRVDSDHRAILQAVAAQDAPAARMAARMHIEQVRLAYAAAGTEPAGTEPAGTEPCG